MTLEEVRNKRDELLRNTDWTQFSDSPLTDDQKRVWAEYRQALRDTPANFNTNTNVFPDVPYAPKDT